MTDEAWRYRKWGSMSNVVLRFFISLDQNIFMRHFILPLLLGCLLFAAGCGQPKVTGTVTFSDGTPLERGAVNFEAGTYIAMGSLDKNGRYSIGGVKAGDGVPPGVYKVTITGAMGVDTASAATAAQSGGMGNLATFVPLIDRKYERAETSGLVCEVKRSTVFNIEVKRPGEE